MSFFLGGGTGGNLPVRDMWICILPKSVRSSLQPSINFSVFLPTSRPEYKCFFLGFFEVKKGFFGLSRLPRVIYVYNANSSVRKRSGFFSRPNPIRLWPALLGSIGLLPPKKEAENAKKEGGEEKRREEKKKRGPAYYLWC